MFAGYSCVIFVHIHAKTGFIAARAGLFVFAMTLRNCEFFRDVGMVCVCVWWWMRNWRICVRLTTDGVRL